MVEQKSIGLLIIIVASSLYLYYTIWILFTPLIDEDHIFQTYFPDRMYGIVIPTLAAYFLISMFLTITGLILI